MNSNPLNELPQISTFLQAIAPLAPAYRHGVFSFVALLHEGEKVLLRGQLRLLVDPPPTVKRSLQTTRLFAGQVALDLDAAAAETCLRCAAAGDWLPPLGNHVLKLLPRDQLGTSPRYSAYHEPADPQHVRDKGAVERLVLTGANCGQLIGVQMAGVGGDLNELGFAFPGQLFGAYGLHGGDDTSLEIIASPLAKIEPESTISGRKVRVRVSLASGVPPERLRITARNADPRDAELPWTIGGADLSWEGSGTYRYAEWHFDLLEDSVLHVGTVYASRVHAEMRVTDPGSTPNRLWRALEHVDPKLERLKELLTSPKMRNKDARDFETGATWLLQLLGFTTLYLGGMSRLTSEPDILAQAPNGDLILVECTIEVPDDGKLNKLIARSKRWEQLVDTYKAVGETITLTPFLLCPLPAEHLAGTRAKATRHSILILCQEDIVEALSLAKFQPNANAVLEHWRLRSLKQIQIQGFQKSGLDE